jgi:hypothetical protein
LRQLATHSSVVHAIDFTAPPDAAFYGAMGIVGAADNSGSANNICCDEARVRRGISSEDWIQANWDTQRVGTDFLTAGEVKCRKAGLIIFVR